VWGVLRLSLTAGEQEKPNAVVRMAAAVDELLREIE